MNALRQERGLALPMVLGIMLVFAVALGSVIVIAGSSQQSAARERQSQTAHAAGEAALATAISQLATAADPRSTSALPSCGAPTTVTLTGSAATYCGTLVGSDWTITATGTAKLEGGAGNVTRTITQVASIVGVIDAGLGQLWNRMYHYDDSQCTEFKKITIVVPVVSRGCVKLKGNTEKPSRLLGSYVSIGSYVELKDTDSIGLSGTPIERADISGTCTLEHGTGPHSPCGPADAVYASTITATAPDLARPTVDFAAAYANAKPGPLYPCTTGSLPAGDAFDKDTTYDGDADKFDLTPKDKTYTCQHWTGATLNGELSWNHTTKVLKIKGTIFFDGEVELTDKVLVNYQGKGWLYTSKKLTLEEYLCAGGDGTNNCTTNISSWDPSQNLLILVTGGTRNIGDETFKMDHDQSAFQGAVWSVGKCKVNKKSSISAPLICGRLAIKEDDFVDDPTVAAWPASLISRPGQLYGSPTAAAGLQIVLREQLG